MERARASCLWITTKKEIKQIQNPTQERRDEGHITKDNSLLICLIRNDWLLIDGERTALTAEYIGSPPDGH